MHPSSAPRISAAAPLSTGDDRLAARPRLLAARTNGPAAHHAHPHQLVCATSHVLADRSQALPHLARRMAPVAAYGQDSKYFDLNVRHLAAVTGGWRGGCVGL